MDVFPGLENGSGDRAASPSLPAFLNHDDNPNGSTPAWIARPAVIDMTADTSVAGGASGRVASSYQGESSLPVHVPRGRCQTAPSYTFQSIDLGIFVAGLVSLISLSLTLKHASSITPAVASIPLTTGGLCVMCFWYRQSAAADDVEESTHPRVTSVSGIDETMQRGPLTYFTFFHAPDVEAGADDKTTTLNQETEQKKFERERQERGDLQKGRTRFVGMHVDVEEGSGRGCTGGSDPGRRPSLDSGSRDSTERTSDVPRETCEVMLTVVRQENRRRAGEKPKSNCSGDKDGLGSSNDLESQDPTASRPKTSPTTPFDATIDSERLSTTPSRSYKKTSADSSVPTKATSLARNDSRLECAGKTCTVCLSDYACGERLCRLPCLHVFHAECIDQWLKRRQFCPLCKIHVRPLGHRRIW